MMMQVALALALLVGSATQVLAQDARVQTAGAVTIIYGSASGLATAGNQVRTQGTAGILGVGEADDWFGLVSQ